MATIGTPIRDLSPSEDRWRRWEQRGVDQDARVARGARIIFGTVLVLLLLVGTFAVLR